MPRIFGREPAALAGLIEAVLATLLAFNMLHLTGETVAAIMAVVTASIGVYVAAVTRDTLLGVVILLVKALIGLGAAYGFELGPDKTAAVIALTTVVLGFFQRTQTTPTAKASLSLAA